MIEDDILDEIKRYEVGIICESEGRKTVLVTNDILLATEKYENIVQNIPNNYKFHIKVFLFDYDKNCNLSYYDNIDDAI